MLPFKEDAGPGLNIYVFLALGVAAISTGAIFIRLAHAPPLVIAAYRVGIATLVILPFGIWKKGDELRRLKLADLKLAFLAGFFLALHFATWVSSLAFTSVANSVILVNTNPIWVGILAPFVTGERLKPATVSGILISVIGAAFIGAGDAAGGGDALWGDFLAVMGGLCAAGYLLVGKQLRRKLSLIAYISVCYGSAAVILWPTVLLLGYPVTGFDAQTYQALVGMALVAQLVGHTTYNWALKYVSTPLVAVSLLGEPVGSSLMAYVLFQESLGWAELAGGAMVLLAIYLTAAGERKPRRSGLTNARQDG